MDPEPLAETSVKKPVTWLQVCVSTAGLTLNSCGHEQMPHVPGAPVFCCLCRTWGQAMWVLWLQPPALPPCCLVVFLSGSWTPLPMSSEPEWAPGAGDGSSQRAGGLGLGARGGGPRGKGSAWTLLRCVWSPGDLVLCTEGAITDPVCSLTRWNGLVPGLLYSCYIP